MTLNKLAIVAPPGVGDAINLCLAVPLSGVITSSSLPCGVRVHRSNDSGHCLWLRYDRPPAVIELAKICGTCGRIINEFGGLAPSGGCLFESVRTRPALVAYLNPMFTLPLLLWRALSRLYGSCRPPAFSCWGAVRARRRFNQILFISEVRVKIK